MAGSSLESARGVNSKWFGRVIYYLPTVKPVHDNYNLKSHKYVCITTYQSDTKSNPNPNPNPNPTTKQHVA